MIRIATVLLASLLLAPSIVESADVAPAPEASAGVQPAQTQQAKKLDVNRAALADLVAVPGIGERMGQAIIEQRTRKGGFTKLDDLLEVRGIKEKKLAALAPYLTVVPVKPVGAPAPNTATK